MVEGGAHRSQNSWLMGQKKSDRGGVHAVDVVRKVFYSMGQRPGKGRGNETDADVAGSGCLANLGSGLCPADVILMMAKF